MFNQKSIVLCLARKEMNATVLHQELFATLGLDAVSYPTMTLIQRETRLTPEQSLAQEPTVEPNPSTIDSAITQALGGESFASVHQLAQRTCLLEPQGQW
jgi:hypothetical protein